jgi:trigger factor
MVEHNHIPDLVAEVVRGKALATIVESAEVTDESGSRVELKLLQPDGSIGEPVAEQPSDEPSSDEPSSDEPSSDEPSSDEPASDGPSSDDATSGEAQGAETEDDRALETS